MTTKTNRPGRVKTLGEWRSREERDVTLPSGAVVTIKLLDTQVYLRHGHTPDGLRSIALGELANRVIAHDATLEERQIAADQLGAAHRAIIAEMLVSPVLTPEEVRDIPGWDLDMLLDIANRVCEEDAAGNAIGLTTSEAATFRSERRGDVGSETRP